MEIISCDAAEAIKKFKSGELESTSDLKGEQITEAVEDCFAITEQKNVLNLHSISP